MRELVDIDTARRKAREIATAAGWTCGKDSSANRSEARYFSIVKGDAHCSVRFAHHERNGLRPGLTMEAYDYYTFWFCYADQIQQFSEWCETH